MLGQFERLAQRGDRWRNLSIGFSILVIGLFKKVVIADSFGLFANPVFAMAQAGEPLFSADALAAARENANRNNIGNVEFLQGDWIGPVAERRFEVIVSNPPYVRDDDEALASLQAEPMLALKAGAEGLDAIEILARGCPAIITSGGLLVIEHGAEQEDAVAELLKAHGWANIRCYKDYSGLPRVTSANYSETP